MTAEPDAPRPARWPAGLALVVLVACLIYLPRLGADGLVDTEGHRAIPAWAMLDSGDYLVPRLFGQPYLRKPPGIQWSIAASSAIFGQTELAARLPSAIASILAVGITFAFAARWFGPRWAVAAGLAHALMPWLWQAGRSAEIEALNNLGAQFALFALIDLLVHQRLRSPRWGARLAMFSLATLGVAIAALAKGPAGLPCFAGALIGCAIATRGERAIWKALVSPWAWGALVIGTIPLGVWVLLVQARLESKGEAAIVQSAEAFLFEPGRLTGILLLAPTAFIAAMPASLAVLFPFGPDARRETEDDDSRTTALRLARALAWSFVLSLAIFTLIGVGNVRYAMPAACLAPPLAAYVLRGLRSRENRFLPRRTLIARIMLLGRAEILMTLLLIAAAAWILAIEPRRDARSGRAAGLRTGEAIADYLRGHRGITGPLYADHLVEARPEVLWYASTTGQYIGTCWMPGLPTTPEPNPDLLYALRMDSGEWSDDLNLTPIHTDCVHVFEFGIFTAR